jgi:hypothetical protein
MSVDNVGVHTSHCCPKCGCKYCDPDCPVELGLLEAEYDCEDCEADREVLRNKFLSMNLYELTETVQYLSDLIKSKGKHE